MTKMPRVARGLFELRDAKAVDIADPESLTLAGETRPTRRNAGDISNLRRNGYFIEHKKPRRRCSDGKRSSCNSCRGLANSERDFHGFRWIEKKHDEYQSLNVSGKGVTATDVSQRSRTEIPGDGLFCPDIASENPYFIAGRTGVTGQQSRVRCRRRQDPLDIACEEEDLEQNPYLVAGGSGVTGQQSRGRRGRRRQNSLESGEEEDFGLSKSESKDVVDAGWKAPKKKIFLKVILPKIT